MAPVKISKFQKTVWDYYKKNKRETLPWRKGITPYKVYVSEIMLQQTQVDRVISFYKKWMKTFPTIKALANAPQSQVLALWKGLGYNSRALRMKKTAEMVVKDFKGIFPKTYEDILLLPGIGPYTAGAISAFAYNQPIAMIETNIRRVFIHELFRGKEKVHDKEILELVEKIVDTKNPREWYWALMDYGSYLGKTIPNPNKKSRHYTKQSQFKGSDREIRGKVLEVLLLKKSLSIERLEGALKSLSEDKERMEMIISGLEREGFLVVNKGKISLK
jgi:A/G-specific adenine glycosylase